MRTLLLSIFSCGCWALESQPAQVISINDGDVITVKLNGVKSVVRLAFIAVPAGKTPKLGGAKSEGQQAKDDLTAMAPVKSSVRLWTDKEQFPQDASGHTVAVVLLGENGQDAAQERLLQDGWAVYSKRGGRAPDPWDVRFNASETTAKESKSGAWATLWDWMVAKASEDVKQPK